MCQAYEAEARLGAWLSERDTRQKLQVLIDRAETGDEPTKAEWSQAMAAAIIAKGSY